MYACVCVPICACAETLEKERRQGEQARSAASNLHTQQVHQLKSELADYQVFSGEEFEGKGVGERNGEWEGEGEGEGEDEGGKEGWEASGLNPKPGILLGKP